MLAILVKVFGIPLESMKRDAWSLPNKISYVRLALCWLPALFVVIGPEGSVLRWIAFVLFIVIAATDGVDGAVARKRKLTSDWGRWLDPVADKLLVVLSFLAIYLVNLGNADTSVAWLFWLSLAREVTLAPAIYLVQRRVVSPTLLGKCKMILQCVAVGAWLLPVVAQVWVGIRWWLTLIAIALVVVSWVEYLVRFVILGRRTHAMNS